MAVAEQVTIKGKTYTAKRLTVKDIREISSELEGGAKQTVIDQLFEDALPSPAFFRSLGVYIDDLDELDPEEIRELMEAVAKANPTYAAMEKRMAARIHQLLNNSTGSAHG